MRNIKEINLSINEKSKHLLKMETENQITNSNHAFMVTLSFKSSLEKLQANRALAKLLKDLKKEVFGRRSKKEIIQIIAIEKNSMNGYHAHILMENPYLRSEKIQTDHPKT